METNIESHGFFGHPRGLSTLFFTEMWERFSYYGMRAILTLYMTKKLAEGGLAFDEKYAALIYATYVSSVWYLPLIGGWLADKGFGARRAVLIGGIIIACGHYSMAIDSLPTFYAALILIALGTGLLKPNISTMVGQLYEPNDKRRDAGFSIFYMGINLGAFISPFVTGFLAQSVMFKGVITKLGLNPAHAWHWGFAAAGVGMTLGVIQYVLGANRLQDAGKKPEKRDPSAEAGAKGFRLKTYFSDRRSAQPSSNAPETQVSSPDRLVEVFIASDGIASQIKGFADLGPAQQIAWTAWLNRFTSLMTFPKRGVRLGQRWKISEPEASPSPIAGV